METIYADEIVEGEVYWGNQCDVDKEEMIAYARENDPWPFLVDEDAARAGAFGAIVACGGYTITLMYRLGNPILNGAGKAWALLTGLDWNVKFPAPVRAGDHLRYKHTVLRKHPSRKPRRAIVSGLAELINQDDRVVLSLEYTCLVANRSK